MENKRKNSNKGISLIVLVITIIVIIILAASVILTLTDNNPIDNAKKATFINDIGTFQSELDIYKANKYAKTLGDYESKKLDADETTLNYNDEKQGTDTMYNVITSLKGLSKYQGKFEIIDGELWYKSTKNKEWALDAGIQVDDGIPKTQVSTIQNLPVKTGVDVEYTVKFSSNVGITTIDLFSKIVVTDESGVAIASQPTVTVGTPTGTVSDTIRTVNLTINTIGMTEGKYRLKILAGAVINEKLAASDKDTLSTTSFEIDNTAPSMPIINVSPEGYTSGNLTVTITPTVQDDKLEYSIDGTNYQIYTIPFNISDNLTISAREIDKSNNVSNIADLLITTIDKISPTISNITNTNTETSITLNVEAKDIGSGVQSYQYSNDNGITWTNNFSSATYVFNGLISGTYECKVKVIDKVGNFIISDKITINNGQLIDSKLLLHFNNLTDSSLVGKTIQNNGTVTFSTTQYKFGGSSAYFDGATTSSLYINDSNGDFNFGIGDFTIDFWMCPSANNVYPNGILTSSTQTSPFWHYFLGSWILMFSDSSNIKLYYATTGSSYRSSSAARITPNVWQHVAMVRNGLNVYVFISGNLAITFPLSSGETFSSDGKFGIGQHDIRTNYNYKGYIDELNISKGVARWTSNFTPPTQAY